MEPEVMTPDESAPVEHLADDATRWEALVYGRMQEGWSFLNASKHADEFIAGVHARRASGAFGGPHSEGPQYAFAPYDNGSLADRDHCAVRGCERLRHEHAASDSSKMDAAPMTVRMACRARTPLDGADAQALEHALVLTEQERDGARQEMRGAMARIESLIRERDSAVRERNEHGERAAVAEAAFEGAHQSSVQAEQERDEQRARAEAAESLERTAKDRRADVEAILKEALGALHRVRYSVNSHDAATIVGDMLSKAKAAGYLP